MAEKTNLLAIWCGVLVFAAAAVFCFLFGARELLAGHRSQSWPSVGGEVISSRLTSGSGTSSGSKPTYSPTIVYRYRVGERTYESDRLRFGATGGSRRAAQRFLDRYPAGAEIDVFHDPKRPEKSVLEPGWTGRSLTFMLVAVPLCGLAYLFYRLRVHV